MKIGDKVDDFELQNQYGEVVKFSNYAGKNVIIFFYPKANTGGCTQQVCNLRDGYKTLSEKGYSLLGISADTPKKQLNFSEKHQLPFPLLADTEKEICQMFGVWALKKFMGREYMGIIRKSFVINSNGIITHIIENVKVKSHTEQLLELL